MIGRFPEAREVNSHAVMISPMIRHLTVKFGSIIGEQVTWRATLLHQAIEDRHHVFPAQTLADFNG
jgi:hypothetical protein